jgi:hypothetical protein
MTNAKKQLTNISCCDILNAQEKGGTIMKNLNTTAKTMDTVFNVLEILAKIAFVGIIVGLVIIAVGFMFDLDPDAIGTGYGAVEVGSLKLDLAEDAVPNKKLILLQVAIEMAASLFVVFIMIRGIRCIRGILQPMMDGTPFFQGVGQRLKTLAIYCFILGAAVNVVQIVSTTMMVMGFDLENLLLNDKIKHVTINTTLDATFLLTGALLLLLSYIFQYGQQLQQLSDETL